MTEHWRYLNKFNAILIGWPEGLEFRRFGRISGGEGRLDQLSGLICAGRLRFKVVSKEEFINIRHEAAKRGWRPSLRRPRMDWNWKRVEIRRRLSRKVAAKPKSKPYVEDSDDEIEQWSEGGAE
ncbi:hypothetical protein BDW22DRAFT_1362105 [Trametopsis cervina]|nr:hypothetical protein BDW22DRAFT_1362105 [Trametopsis cervina]